MSKETMFLVWLGLLASLILMLIPAFRTVASGIFSTLLTPAFLGILRAIWIYLFVIVKRVMVSHKIVITNLCMPRSVIFPSLEKEEENNPKQ